MTSNSTAASDAKPLRVAVVGGGIAGLSLAVGLLQEIEKGANLELTVYEQASKFAEIGAGVSLGPNAQRALVLLGLEKQVKALRGSSLENKDLWFEFRFSEESHPRCGEIITRVQGDNAGSGHVHRADFLNYLIQIVPTEVCKHHKRVVDFETRDEHAVLHFADGSSAETDLIVACDGVKSPMRKALYKKLGIEGSKQQEKYAEWVAWRGLIPQDVYESSFGRETKFPQMLLGLDRHILTFPVKNGTMMNMVGFVRDPERKKLDGHDAPWQEERSKEEMLEDFKGFMPSVVQMIHAIPKTSIWGIFDLPPLPTAIGERVILAGDAAHGTTPHQGSGAGVCIEDALFLSRLLAHPKVSGRPTGEGLRNALQIYQDVRHERAAKVQVTSAECGLVYEGRGVGGEGQDYDKVKANLDQRMKWIWEYDIDAELQAMTKLAAAL